MNGTKEMLADIWQNIVIHGYWRNLIITAAHKKGSKTNPQSYKEGGIGSTMLKLCMTIIIERIRPWYHQQLQESQYVFDNGLMSKFCRY